MKRNFIFLFCLFTFLTINLYTQKTEYVTFKPDKPKLGDVITITYNSEHPKAALKNLAEIYIEALECPVQETPSIKEIKMVKNGNVFTCRYKIENEKTVLSLVRFVSGDSIDDNSKNSWCMMVHGKNNKPVKGAYLQIYNLLNSENYYGFFLKVDKELAKNVLQKELDLHQDNILAYSRSWTLLLRKDQGDKTKEKIKKELEKVFNKSKGNESNIPTFAYWFNYTGQGERINQIIEKKSATDPKGKYARARIEIEINNEKDALKKIELTEKLLSDFPNLTAAEKDKLLGNVFYLDIGLKKYDKAIQALEKIQQKDFNNYLIVVRSMIENKFDLDKAVDLAKNVVDMINNSYISNKPPYMSTRDWEKSREYTLSRALETYGYGLLESGKYKEADIIYEDLYNKNKANLPNFSERYLECLVKNAKYEKALQFAEKFIREKKVSDRFIENYRITFLKIKGGEKEFDKIITEYKNKQKNELIMKLKKEKVNKPAPDFNLKSLDGKMVKLSDLKGKIVVVDFWATWCGPCKASFPVLQKIYDKYKDNKDIVILALDTWEKEKGEEKEKNVKKFIEENKYTFTVLFDEGMVEKYGVSGIPTKFIIDKAGNIQFKTIGYAGEEYMISEMEAQFEILLDNN